MNEWTSCGVAIEGQRIDVGGINPWNFHWIRLKQPSVELPHPAYPNQRHRMSLYEVDNVGQKVIFAAGELSPNVWGFYIPASTRTYPRQA